MTTKENLEYYSSYFEAVLFGETRMSECDSCDGTFEDFSIYDIDEKSLIEQFADLDKFFSEVDEILENTDYTHDQACHDFYFTRVGHGVGFWENDHCEDKEGKLLTDIAQKYRELYCYDENGTVFISNC